MILRRQFFLAVLAATLTAGASAQPAQGFAPDSPNHGSSPNSAAARTAAVRPESPASTDYYSWEPKVDRWITLNEMTYSMRYRGVTDLNGAHEFKQAQERSILDGRCKFDAQGKYAVAFHASSGKYFNWAYADFIGGGNKQAFLIEKAAATPTEKIKFGRAAALDPANYAASQQSGGWSFFLRQFYLDAQPIKGIELQYGGLGINRG